MVFVVISVSFVVLLFVCCLIEFVLTWFCLVVDFQLGFVCLFWCFCDLWWTLLLFGAADAGWFSVLGLVWICVCVTLLSLCLLVVCVDLLCSFRFRFALVVVDL